MIVSMEEYVALKSHESHKFFLSKLFVYRLENVRHKIKTQHNGLPKTMLIYNFNFLKILETITLEAFKLEFPSFEKYPVGALYTFTFFNLMLYYCIHFRKFKTSGIWCIIFQIHARINGQTRQCLSSVLLSSLIGWSSWLNYSFSHCFMFLPNYLFVGK